MTDEWAKAVQEAAKTGSKITDAARDLVTSDLVREHGEDAPLNPQGRLVRLKN